MWKKDQTDAELSAYLDGEVSAADAAKLDRHLDEHADRRQQLERYSRIAHWTRRALVAPAPADATTCAERVIAALRPALPAPKARTYNPLMVASVGLLTVAGLTAAGLAALRYRGSGR
jgi:anti-sigma factor RsiW